MRDRTTTVTMLALSLVFVGGPVSHGAQSPVQSPAPTAMQDDAPVMQQRMKAASDGRSVGASSGATSASLPSSVSPAIERFARANGLDTSPESPVPDGRTAQPAATRSVPPVVARARAARGVPSLRQQRGAAPRSSLVSTAKLKPAPYDKHDLRFPINLATALRLSDARPLMVAAAQARTWVAEAELSQAKVLWLPDINLAFDYLRHDGGGPDFNKGILTTPSTNFFYGGGGLVGFINTTDAFFEPLAARRVLNSRQWDIQSAKNDALRETASAYFAVHEYRGTYAGGLYMVERARDVVSRLSELSRDLVQTFEVERARNMMADIEQQAVSARESWRVQSARLTKVLRLDPRAVVEPLEHDHMQITLVDPGRELDDLISIALANRPEVASRRALIEAAEIRVRREKARPLIPVFVLTGFQSPGGMLIQGGIFGLGANNSMNQWSGRDDVSVQLVWQLENFGIGNLAKIKKQRGKLSDAIIDLRREQDTVAEEVNQARARLQSAAGRVAQANRALRTGIITFNGAIEGLEQTTRFGDVLELITRPQEAVYAVQLLKTAFDEYYSTVAEYNRAQFELFHSLGYPAHEIARLAPPGKIVPIDTTRPEYLPSVGNGPPPASR